MACNATYGTTTSKTAPSPPSLTSLLWNHRHIVSYFSSCSVFEQQFGQLESSSEGERRNCSNKQRIIEWRKRKNKYREKEREKHNSKTNTHPICVYEREIDRTPLPDSKGRWIVRLSDTFRMSVMSGECLLCLMNVWWMSVMSDECLLCLMNVW